MNLPAIAYSEYRPDPTTPYEAWCEAYLVEALKSDEIETAMTVHDDMRTQFDATVLFLVFDAPRFSPICLKEFRRQTAHVTLDGLIALLDGGDIDPVEIVRLALFAGDEARQGWPVDVRHQMDRFHDQIIEAAPSWHWVRNIFDRRAES